MTSFRGHPVGERGKARGGSALLTTASTRSFAWDEKVMADETIDLVDDQRLEPSAHPCMSEALR